MREKRSADPGFLHLSLIIILALIAYAPVLNAGFTNWDDDVYVTKNPLIRSLSFSNIGAIFTSPVAGNYQPLVILSYAIDYFFKGPEPVVFHMTNILIHALNCVLVYFLCKRIIRKDYFSLCIAIVFALHPLHVEAVAWISGRKDLLCTFFYLAALLSYFNFTRRRNIGTYFLVLLFCILALLSKATAVSFFLVAFAVDYLMERKLSLQQQLIEKTPLLILSVIFGLIALYTQSSVDAMYMTDKINWDESIVYASTAFVTYLFKFLIPVNLSAFYPYPTLLSWYLWLTLLFCLAGLTWWMIKFRSLPRLFNFGCFLFLFQVIFILQLIPVGNAMMADRYMYFPLAGLLIAAAGLFEKFLTKENFRFPMIFLSCALLFLTMFRTGVWKNNLSLWSDVINQYPNVAKAYNNRGLAYMDEQSIQKAMDDFNHAVSLDPYFWEAHSNLGWAYTARQNYPEAIKKYDIAISLHPSDARMFSNRGFALMYLEHYNEALSDMNKAITLNPDFAEAYNNRGLTQLKLKNYPEAEKDINYSIKLFPQNSYAYRNLGLFYSEQKDSLRACECFQKAEKLGFSKTYGDEIFKLLKKCPQ